MLEKPDIVETSIAACLRDSYGIAVSSITFLPLGADRHTAVYRARGNHADLFIKLRSGNFDHAAVIIPRLLHAYGIGQIISPIPNQQGSLWTVLEGYMLILYPFIDGQDGFTRPLTAENWFALGRSLKAIHAAVLPADSVQTLPRETYSPHWRERVTLFLKQVEEQSFSDPIAAEFAAFLHEKAAEISALVTYAHSLASVVQKRGLPETVCHADIHIGNVLITESGMLYVVDWDTLMLAPKERDLMFIGMGMAHSATLTEDEQTVLFYQGYGPCEIDTAAVAYYRCERVVQDAEAYSEQILLASGSELDRQEGLRQFRSQFEPGCVVERALLAANQFYLP